MRGSWKKSNQNLCDSTLPLSLARPALEQSQEMMKVSRQRSSRQRKNESTGLRTSRKRDKASSSDKSENSRDEPRRAYSQPIAEDWEE